MQKGGVVFAEAKSGGWRKFFTGPVNGKALDQRQRPLIPRLGGEQGLMAEKPELLNIRHRRAPGRGDREQTFGFTAGIIFMTGIGLKLLAQVAWIGGGDEGGEPKIPLAGQGVPGRIVVALPQ